MATKKNMTMAELDARWASKTEKKSTGTKLALAQSYEDIREEEKREEGAEMTLDDLQKKWAGNSSRSAQSKYDYEQEYEQQGSEEDKSKQPGFWSALGENLVQGTRQAVFNIDNALMEDTARAYDPKTNLSYRLALALAPESVKPTEEGLETTRQIQQGLRAQTDKNVALHEQEQQKLAEKYSDAGLAAKAGQIIGQGMGSMVPAAAVGALAGPMGSYMTMFGQGYGQGYVSAKQDGASEEQAHRNAVGSGLVTAGVEALSGSIGGLRLPGGAGVLDDLVGGFVDSNVKNKTLNQLVKYLADATGEGLEEVAEDLIQPLVSKSTYGKETGVERLMKGETTLEEIGSALGEDFLGGFLTSAFMGGAQKIGSAAVQKVHGTGDNAQVQQDEQNTEQVQQDALSAPQTQQETVLEGLKESDSRSQDSPQNAPQDDSVKEWMKRSGVDVIGLDEDSAAVMADAYDGSMDEAVYEAGWGALYNIGKNGIADDAQKAVQLGGLQAAALAPDLQKLAFNQGMAERIAADGRAQRVSQIADQSDYSDGMKQLFKDSYGGGSISVYQKAMDGMYRAGKTGILNYEQAVRGNRAAAAVVQNRDALRKAYELGAAQVQTAAESAASAPQKIGVQYEGNAEQNSQIPAELLKATAEKLGIDIRVVERLGDGAGGTANGMWAAGISRMVLGNNSSNQYQTMQHEITHYMSSTNPEGSKKLQSMVLDFYAGEKGMDKLTELSERYRQAYENERLSADELARDLWSGIMSSEEGTKAFCEYVAESDTTVPEKKTVFQTLKSLLDRVVEKIRGLLKGGDATLGAAEGRTLSEQADMAEKQSALIREYLKELDTASKNARRQESRAESVQVEQAASVAFSYPEDTKLEYKMKQAAADMEKQPEVTSVKMEYAFTEGKKPVDAAAEFFESIGGQVERPGLGTVLLTKRGVRNDLAHGYNAAKLATIRAVPDVIKKGTVIDEQKNWKGRGYDSVTIMAPVSVLDGERTHRSYVAAVLKKANAEDARFHLHEVVDETGNRVMFAQTSDQKATRKDTPINTGPYAEESAGTNTREGASIISIQENQDDVNGNNDEKMPLDVQFSRETDLQEENESLKKEKQDLNRRISRMEEQVRLLKEETRLSGGHVMDPKSVKKAAWNLLKKYESKYDRKTLEKELNGLFEQIANDPDMSWEQAMSSSTALMRDVLEQSERANRDLYEQYRPLREDVKNRKFLVKKNSPEYFELINRFGDGVNGQNWGNVRKALFGRVNVSLTEGAGNMDSLFKELEESYPATFDEHADVVRNVERALAVFEVSKVEVSNPYGFDLDGVAAFAGQELLEAYMDTPERHTFADRQHQQALMAKAEYKRNKQEALAEQKENYEQKIRELRQENAGKMLKARENLNKANKEKNAALVQKYQNQIELLKKQNSEKILEQKAAFDLRMENRNEGLQWRQGRDSVQRNVRKLQRWLDTPTEQGYVQERMKRATLNLLNSFDWNTSREGTATKQRWQETMKDFRSMADDMANMDISDEMEWVDFDPDLPAMIDELLESADDVKSIDKLSAAKMRQLNNVLETVSHSITEANKMMAQRNGETVKAVGDASIGELYDAKKRQVRNRSELLKKAMDIRVVDEVAGMAGLDMMDAGRYFDSLGDSSKKVYKAIRDGFDTRVWKLKEAQSYMEGVLKGHDTKTWTGDKAKKHKFTLQSYATGTKTVIEMTTGQIMELYCLSQRPQAKEHLMTGGISLDRGNGRKGARVNLQPSQLAEIVGTLTPEQVRVADQMQHYLSGEVAGWGNEVSMKQYGIRKFTEPHYWPIKTDANFTRTSDASESSGGLYGIRNMGFTKKVQKKANNPIIIHDVFDTWSDHVACMATYNAWTIPLSDAMKWFNYRSEQGSSVKEGIEELYGKKGKSYFISLMKDINGMSGQANPTSTGRVLGRFVTPWKVAKVGFNLRVAIQQPTAYLRAGMVLSPISLTTALAKAPLEYRRGMKMAEEHCGIAQWKRWGYFETNIGQSMKSLLTGQQTIVEKLQDKSTALAEMGDKVTWGTLWLACEEEVKAKQPEIDTDSKPFVDAVSNLLSEVIDKTQVVDSVLHRSQVMRNKNPLIQMEMNFMAEPTKAWNLMREAFVDMVQKKPGAKKKFGRALGTYAVTAFGTAAAASLVDSVRIGSNDKDKDWSERYFDALMENFIDGVNLINNLPLVKDIMSMWGGYDVDRTDLAAISDLFTTVSAWQKMMEGTGKATPYQLIYKTANVVSEFSGIPLGNAVREVKSLYDLFTSMMDPLHIDEKINKTYSTVNDSLYKGDEEHAQDVLNEILKVKKEGGKTEKDIRGDLRTSMTSYWKPIYLEADKDEREEIEDKLTGIRCGSLTVYEKEDFVNWLK